MKSSKFSKRDSAKPKFTSTAPQKSANGSNRRKKMLVVKISPKTFYQ
ncbi:hypothetical protein PT276_10220 [Orbaceae bacterium ESL0721]|nr:hypothetical protein [Orbaceae bacterium ESL0721]